MEIFFFTNLLQYVSYVSKKLADAQLRTGEREDVSKTHMYLIRGSEFCFENNVWGVNWHFVLLWVFLSVSPWRCSESWSCMLTGGWWQAQIVGRDSHTPVWTLLLSSSTYWSLYEPTVRIGGQGSCYCRLNEDYCKEWILELYKLCFIMCFNLCLNNHCWVHHKALKHNINMRELTNSYHFIQLAKTNK